MTLVDLCQLIRHYWKIAIVVPVACALAAVFFSMCVSPKYEASASIVAGDPSGNVPIDNMLMVANDLAQSLIAAEATSGSDMRASVEVDSAARTLTLTVEGPVGHDCVTFANALSSDIAIESKSVFERLQEAREADLADLGALNTSEDVAAVLSGSLLQNVLDSGHSFEFCSFTVFEAKKAESAGVGLPTLVLAGFAGGVFLVVIIVVVVSAVKRPIMSREEVEEASKLPVLNAEGASDLGSRLWANIQFNASGVVDSVCFVPLNGDSAKTCAEALGSSILRSGRTVSVRGVQEDGFVADDGDLSSCSIYHCAPLDEGVGGLYCAHSSSTTVICARRWDDSFESLENTMRNLSLAKANVAGIALL